MAVLVHNQGADWNQGLYQAIFDRVIPDRSRPPAGLIAHVGAPGADWTAPGLVEARAVGSLQGWGFPHHDLSSSRRW